GPIGLIDDILVVSAALSLLLNDVHPDVVRAHWSGRGDALDAIQRASQWSRSFLRRNFGSALRRGVRLGWAARGARSKRSLSARGAPRAAAARGPRKGFVARSSASVDGTVISAGVASCQSAAALARTTRTRSSFCCTAAFFGSTCSAKRRLLSVYSWPQ